MADKKKYWGISLNRQYFQGEVVGEPQFFDNSSGGQLATLNLMMYVSELSANGQWVETEVLVPITVLDGNKVEAVRKYVQSGRQLYVETYYKSWEVDGVFQHANVVTKLQYGYKPKEDSAKQVGGGPAVPQP